MFLSLLCSCLYLRSCRSLCSYQIPPPLTFLCRYGSGRYEHVFETTTAGVTIQSPQLDINTVAAGGGSRLFWRNGLFVVGPESAGAHPGPACKYLTTFLLRSRILTQDRLPKRRAAYGNRRKSISWSSLA
jgi:hypothetical protein